MSSSLQFPSQETIQNYLENKHPCTKNDSYMKEKKVLKAAAITFANMSILQEKMPMELTSMLHRIGYKVPQFAIMTAIMNLSVALRDCAEGR